MQFPPENFENLRKILILLRNGEIQLDIGKKSFSALALMVKNPDIVATSTIVELSPLVSISPASITRLSKLLGFSGYNAFRQVFKQSSTTKTNYYSQSIQEIVKDISFTNKELILNQLKSTTENMQQCLNNTTDEDINRVVELLAIKRKVFVFGHQQSSAIASILKYGLSLIRTNIHMLGPTEQGLATAVGQLQKNDLLLIISSSPYSQLTIDIATIAANLECHLVALTDSKLSPLHELATISISLPTQGLYFTNSLAANCILIESLLSLTAIELGQSAIDKLTQHENLLNQLNVNA